mmetsp:Transcript_98816/g.316795  ORF Transcript_98816/g.316795 Transcript_98816/m.316795 type:complete len:181 (+) Transcript_98816:59-601(+)
MAPDIVALVRSALLHLVTPGSGQRRRGLAADARRPWHDLQLTSHCALVPAIWRAARAPDPLPELVVLQGLVLVLSLLYHRNFERPGLLATLEGTSAKLLFLYGALQTVRSPTRPVLLANVCLGLATLFFFLLTNLDKKRFYDRWHPLGLHVLPGCWSLVVVCWNDSLLSFFRDGAPASPS